jgi:hypothetical protein
MKKTEGTPVLEHPGESTKKPHVIGSNIVADNITNQTVKVSIRLCC